MFALRVAVGLLCFIVLLVMLTQVVIPALRGKRLWPGFRKTAADAKREQVEDLQEEVEQTGRLAELSKKEAELRTELRRYNQPQEESKDK